MNIHLVGMPMKMDTLDPMEVGGAIALAQPTAEAIRKLLYSSWKDIAFEYDGLTSEEKRCITEEQFNQIVEWVRTAHGEEWAARTPKDTIKDT